MGQVGDNGWEMVRLFGVYNEASGNALAPKEPAEYPKWCIPIILWVPPNTHNVSEYSSCTLPTTTEKEHRLILQMRRISADESRHQIDQDRTCKSEVREEQKEDKHREQQNEVSETDDPEEG